MRRQSPPALPLLVTLALSGLTLLLAARVEAFADPAPAPPSRVASLRRLGAVEGPGGAVATRKAFRAALKQLGANHPPGGLLYVPAGDWWVDRPIIVDSGQITIRGDGRGVSRLSTQYVGAPLIVGAKRDPVPAAAFPDAFGVLDASAAPAKGKRYGLRGGGKLAIYEWGGPLALGPPQTHWGGVKQVTFDWCVDTSKYAGPHCALFSLRSKVDQYLASPWHIGLFGPNWHLVFLLSDGKQYDWQVPAKKGLARCSLQCDFDKGVLALWQDGVLLGTKTIPPGLSLAENPAMPFRCDPGQDVTIWGFRVTPTLRYKMTQGRQAATDGSTLTDAWRFETNTGRPVAWLGLRDDPADLSASRLPTVYHGSGAGAIGDGYAPTHAVLIDLLGGAAGMAPTILNVTVGDMTIQAPAEYGAALEIAMAVGVLVEKCELKGGAWGLATTNVVPQWSIRVRDCYCAGYDAAVYIHDTTWAATGLDVQQGAWAAMRLPRTGSLFDEVFVIGQGPCRYGILGGGSLQARNLCLDWEDYTNPTNALIDWTLDTDEPGVIPMLTIDLLQSGVIGKKAVLLDLHGPQYPSRTSRVSIGVLGTINYGAGAVRVDKPNVIGTIPSFTVPGLGPGPPPILYVGPAGTVCGIRATDPAQGGGPGPEPDHKPRDKDAAPVATDDARSKPSPPK